MLILMNFRLNFVNKTNFWQISFSDTSITAFPCNWFFLRSYVFYVFKSTLFWNKIRNTKEYKNSWIKRISGITSFESPTSVAPELCSTCVLACSAIYLTWHFDHVLVDRISLALGTPPSFSFRAKRRRRESIETKTSSSSRLGLVSSTSRSSLSSVSSPTSSLSSWHRLIPLDISTLSRLVTFDDVGSKSSTFPHLLARRQRRRRAISSRELVETRFSPPTAGQRFLRVPTYFLARFNSLGFAPLGNIDAIRLFPSNSLGIAHTHTYIRTHNIRAVGRRKTRASAIDIHGIFKGCRFRAQVLSWNKTLDTKLDGRSRIFPRFRARLYRIRFISRLMKCYSGWKAFFAMRARTSVRFARTSCEKNGRDKTFGGRDALTIFTTAMGSIFIRLGYTYRLSPWWRRLCLLMEQCS